MYTFCLNVCHNHLYGFIFWHCEVWKPQNIRVDMKCSATTAPFYIGYARFSFVNAHLTTNSILKKDAE
jgi:hypothetical protein